MEIISREEAIARGLAWYFTGKSCKHGHVVKRNACNGSCRACKWKGAKDQRLMTFVEWEREHARLKAEKHEQWLKDRKQPLEIVERLLS